MYREPKISNRHLDTPRDKPAAERVEHANIERPGAQAHPRASGWNMVTAAQAWRLR